MTDDPVRAPQALRDEEAFVALAETLSSLIALIQGDKLIYVNPAGAAILGYPQAYYKGRNFWDFALPEDREKIIARGRARQMGLEQPRRFIERLRHANGHTIWVDYSVDVIQIKGQVTTLVTGRDITEQKKNEESLEKNAALFRSLFTQTPVMMCAVDLQDHFTEVSDFWAQKLGYTREELVGRKTWSVTAEESTRRFQAIIEKKAAARDWYIKDIPLQLIRKDGTLLDIVLTCMPELGPDGDPRRWLCVAQDLSEIKSTQKALQASEERFQAAFQNAAIGKAITDADRRFTQVNRAFCTMLGYTEAELIGRTPRDITHPDHLRQSQEFIEGILKSDEGSKRQVKRYVHKDGHAVWVDMTATLVRGEDGKPAYYVTEIQDITERKLAEANLQQSEERFRSAFYNAAIGKVITSAQSFKLLQVNRAFCEMLGYLPDELVGRSPTEITHPDDRPGDRGLVKNCLDGAQTSGSLIKRYLHKDGRIVWGSLTTTIVRDADGTPSYFVTEVVDITERKHAEELLRDREAKLTEAQRIAKLGRWEWDVEKDIVTWSEEMFRIFGITPAEFAGNYHAVFSRIHPEDVKRIASQVANAVEKGTPHEQEYRAVRPNGEYRHVWATNESVYDANGKVIRMYGVARDITDRKRAEEVIRDREAKLNEAQAVAHVGSWEYDIASNSSVWSDEMYRLFDVDPKTFNPSKENAFARFHPEDLPRVAAVVEKAIQDGQPFEFDSRLVRKDGTVMTFHAIGRSHLDAAGRPAKLFGVLQDITERKRAEEVIRDREAKLEEAQRVAHLGSWEYDLKTDKFIWSAELYRIIGIQPGEWAPTKEDAVRRYIPEDQARVSEIVTRAVESGNPFDYEARFLRDGDLRTVRVIGRVDKDADGRPARLYGISQDVTERKMAEQLLKNREANLAEAQRVAHLGSWEWDVATNRVDWSDELYCILGLDPATSTSSYDGYINHIHPDDRADLSLLVERAVKEGTGYESEHRIVRDNGEVRNVWVSCRLDLDASGKASRLYGIVQDITDRKRALEALRTSEQRFRSLYSQAPVMMTAMDPEGRVREVSNYWLKVMGYDRDEVVDQDGFRFITADSKLRLEQALAEALMSGERVVRNVPMVGIRKNGSPIDVLVTSVLEMTPQGQPVGAIVVGIDVSDIRRAEEAVRESEARYRTLVEHAPEAIAVLDVETGRFIDINKNAEVLFGLTRDQLLARGPLDICPQTQASGRRSSDVAWDAIGRVMRGETASFEFVHSHSSGREIPCQVRLSRLPATGQNLIRATLTDISDQKALEEKVRHAEKMAAIGLLAAGVAHEIGNPLLALSMAAQSLERRFAEEYAQKKLGLIREHIERISKIVRQMSDLARPQSVQKSSCDVNRVLERTAEIVRYDKRAKEVPLQFMPCPDIPFVQGVEDQLTQVCLNLSLNALDAVATNPESRPKSLKISVKCVTRDGRKHVRASFLDSGPGIPEEARSKIFQPFFTSKPTGKGTGLGLSVSYKIIEEHQGTLAFDCRPEGTEFYFDLPIQEKP